MKNWYYQRFIYEHSVRMPFLMRYPAEIPAGSVREDLLTNLDFAPTLLDYAGLTLPARVPGDVMADLLRAGRIPDPFHRENEKGLQWIGECGWVYERRFDVPAALLREERVLLQCDGLDTFAAMQINGRAVARTDNMHRAYECDVKRLLRPGANTIRVAFASVNAYTRKRFRERPIRSRVWEGHPSAYPAWVRKMACNFDWDWGPILVAARHGRPAAL